MSTPFIPSQWKVSIQSRFTANKDRPKATNTSLNFAHVLLCCSGAIKNSSWSGLHVSVDIRLLRVENGSNQNGRNVPVVDDGWFMEQW